MSDEKTEGGLSEGDRYELLAGVFRKMPSEFNGMPLARLTAGRWQLLQERGNSFLFGAGGEGEDGDQEGGEEADGERSTRDDFAGVCEFLWLHTAPVEEIQEAAADPERWARAVQSFALEHGDIAALVEFLRDFESEWLALQAAMVEAVEDDGDAGEEEDDEGEGKPERSRTGSRVISTPSEGTGAPSGGDIFCGSSSSPKGSSISTAPTGRPGRDASGAGSRRTARLERPPDPRGSFSSSDSGSGRSGVWRVLEDWRMRSEEKKEWEALECQGCGSVVCKVKGEERPERCGSCGRGGTE